MTFEANTTSDGFTAYSPDIGWFRSEEGLWPWLYSLSDQSWYWFGWGNGETFFLYASETDQWVKAGV